MNKVPNPYITYNKRTDTFSVRCWIQGKRKVVARVRNIELAETILDDAKHGFINTTQYPNTSTDHKSTD